MAPRRSAASPVRMAWAAAAVSAVVMVIAVASCSGAPESPHHTPAHLLDPADDLAPTPDVPALRESTEARLRRELTVSQLETRFAEARRFEQRHTAPEQWARVDAAWRTLLADERWERDGIPADESAVRLRAKAVKARATARERFEVAGRDAIRVALAKARGFASHGYLQHAARALSSVPGVFHELPEYRQVTAARRALLRHLAANG